MTGATEATAGGYEIGLMLGDGIGPEIVPGAVEVMDCAVERAGAPPLRWVELPVGWAGIDEYGQPLPEAVVERLRGLEAWMTGPHNAGSYPPHAQGNFSGGIRRTFELYANIRPSRSLPAVPCLAPGMDLVTVRENTEGFYADRNMHHGPGEFMPTPDVALATGVFTRHAIERIAHVAFRLARTRRKRVTVVHKANVLKLSMGFMLRTIADVAEEYPDVHVDDSHVDAMAAHLVRHGHAYDVVLAENMFGDIISDIAAELTGALGLAPSLNTSDTQAMAQAVHGSAPDIAGRGIANPVGIMRSGGMLLGWLADRHGDQRLEAAAALVDRAVGATLAAGLRTADLGGDTGTESFTAAVVETLTSDEAR